MTWGNANASSVIQKFGSQKGLLNKQQLHKILKENEKIQPQKL